MSYTYSIKINDITKNIMDLKTKCSQLLDYWFSGSTKDKLSRWFSKNGTIKQQKLDEEVKQRFGDLFFSIETVSIQLDVCDFKDCLSLIILRDQIARHIYREIKTDTPDVWNRLIMIQHDNAINITNHILHQKWFELYSPEELVFILLPFRHTPNTHHEQINHHQILLDVISKLKSPYLEDPIFKRFVHTTYVKLLSNMKDRILGNIQSEIWDCEETTTKQRLSVLEKPEHNFLRKYYSQDIFLKGKIKKEKLYLYCISWIREILSKKPDDVSNHFIISLSGGVDSMVLSYILSIIQENRRQLKLPMFHMSAIHIDYGNRPESYIERDYVSAWCLNKYTQFYPLVYSLQRANCDRELYEKTTREIRFEAYKYLVKKHNSIGILLGHQEDDKVENIFTNIMNGRSLLQLEVLHPYNVINDVPIYRPLLSFKKEEIFRIAHTYRIPYFKNTTPDWSNRGILRNSVLPAVISRYGKTAVHNNVLLIGKSSSEWQTVIFKKIIEPFLETVEYYEGGIIFPLDSVLDMPKVFWESVLMKLFHSMDLSMISNKTIDFFHTVLLGKSFLTKPLWFTFKKSCIGLLYMDHSLEKAYCVLLPLHRPITPITKTINISFPEHLETHSIKLSNWIINLTRKKFIKDEISSIEDLKTILLPNTSYSDFLKGTIQYCILPNMLKEIPSRENNFSIHMKYRRRLFDVISDFYKRKKIPIIESIDVNEKIIGTHRLLTKRTLTKLFVYIEERGEIELTVINIVDDI